ncbi:endonuclease domain-containing protein [Pseudanabaenaceae cyanobacterium LEGE 13415]|nr:endonuclease domain-containing protein [Pseudanabaenaceae cyanobacterium LEGE 13415]
MRKTTSRIRGTTPEIEAAAFHLRQNLTRAETLLWQALQRRQLNNLKFRCQHPIGRFIVDFYCPTCKLVVEVDGNSHDQQVEYDVERTQHLNLYGYRVIRFRNQEVMQNLDLVLAQILTASERNEFEEAP